MKFVVIQTNIFVIIYHLYKSQIAELRQFKLADPQILFNKSLSIDVIIGCDYYADFMTTNVVKTNFGPNVIRSKIGDLVYGKICSENAHFVGKKPLICNFVSQLSINDNYPRLSDLDSKVDRLWNLESLGILPTDDQEVVHQQFNDSIKEVPIKNGEVRYELELPWKTNVWTKLPDNRHVAVRRLDNLLQKTAGVTLDTAANLALLWAKKCTKNSLLLLGSQIVGETCDDIHFNIYISFKKNNWN